MSQKSKDKVDQESEGIQEPTAPSPEPDETKEEILEGEVLAPGETEEAPGEPEDKADLDADTQPEAPQVGKEPEEPSLQALYEACMEKAEANRNDYLRSVADMQNLRKRTARDIKQARSFAIEGFARDLLPVSDNMIRALAALADNEDPAVKSLYEGVEMVQKELDRAFDKHGLERIEALNAPFDPNLHQAVVQMDAPDAKPGQVVQEMQVGYTLNGRLLRPAMVGVAKADDS
ncbi:MAG: nucleotide exchange factor GrpE [Magnetococcales bacterium]|nr:nucleotide exchange factor GrpE [Magnetococcales bacterium]